MLTTNRLRPRTTPWSLWNQVHEEFNRELSDWFTTALSASQAPVGVWTKGDAAIVAMELPGRELDEIDVSVHRDVVTIEARPHEDPLPEGAKSLRRERSLEGVQRQVQLPFELDSEQVEATYERGLLVLRLAAHESAQPAKIEVKAG